MWDPQNEWFIMENPIKNGWFKGTPDLGNLHFDGEEMIRHQIFGHPIFGQTQIWNECRGDLGA